MILDFNVIFTCKLLNRSIISSLSYKNIWVSPSTFLKYRLTIFDVLSHGAIILPSSKALVFIASKNNNIKYIQACYTLASENTLKREFDAFLDINDNYSKYVISIDREDYSQNGIKHINIFDFLMNDDF